MLLLTDTKSTRIEIVMNYPKDVLLMHLKKRIISSVFAYEFQIASKQQDSNFIVSRVLRECEKPYEQQ